MHGITEQLAWCLHAYKECLFVASTDLRLQTYGLEVVEQRTQFLDSGSGI